VIDLLRMVYDSFHSDYFYCLGVLRVLIKAKRALPVSARYFWIGSDSTVLTLASPSTNEGIWHCAMSRLPYVADEASLHRTILTEWLELDFHKYHLNTSSDPQVLIKPTNNNHLILPAKNKPSSQSPSPTPNSSITLTTLQSLLSAINPIKPCPMSLISLYLCSSAMWLLITTAELFNAEARSSSSVSAAPEGVVVGSGRPEGSLACVARWARSALRVWRVCSRVDFLVCRAERRGVNGRVSVVVGLVCEVVSMLISGLFEEDCGAV
jgi:hypothetical protein